MFRQVFTIFHWQELPIQVSLYRPRKETVRSVLLYLHGGGLVAGQRDDLPEAYLQALIEAGIGILSLDYPLAPESKLDDILAVLAKLLEWHEAKGYRLFNQTEAHYFLFGRSAGAFLALQLAARGLAPRCRGLISLYGYTSLQLAAFNLPSRHYLTYPSVSQEEVAKLIQDKPLTQGYLLLRYPIYLYARQSGKWLSLLLADTANAASYDLTAEQLQALPPCFIAHAVGDPDVPIQQSRRLAELVPDAYLQEVASQEHDFDRTAIEELGLPLYHDIIQWLQQHI